MDPTKTTAVETDHPSLVLRILGYTLPQDDECSEQEHDRQRWFSEFDEDAHCF